MSDFLITSLIASVVLTLVLNLGPMLFPKSSRKLEKRVHDKLNENLVKDESGKRPRVRVFFPWKAMLTISLILTVLVNLVGLFSRG